MAISIVNRNIKFVRKKMGLNQEELGALLGIDGQMVSVYETGRFEPKTSYIVTLCCLARVTMDEFTGIDFEQSNYRYLDIKRTYQVQQRG